MIARLTRALMVAACLGYAGPALAQTNAFRPLVQPASPDVFGTAAVGAGVTFYDARFRRVSNADRTHPALIEIAQGLQGLTPEQQLVKVQTEVRRRVQWARDLDTVKVSELWSNAGETLERGKGDVEDIAVVEMQALKLAGWNPRDLYISIGRQKPVGRHLVLLARTPSGFYVLDAMANRPLTPQQHGRFKPVMTLGQGKSWVHGRRISGTAGRASAR